MELKQKERINILEYWRAFESFLMPKIEHKSKPIDVERKPLILTSNTKLPWPLPHNIVESKKEESRFVFNVYVGLLEQTLINEKIQKILHDNKVDYDLNSSRSLTCLFGFTLDDEGCLLNESYITPDYVTSLYALENFNQQVGWKEAHKKSIQHFEALGDAFSSQQIDVITFDIIASHLNKVLEFFECITSEDIKFTAVVHIKKIKAPNNLEDIEINETIDFDDLEEENTVTEVTDDEDKEVKKKQATTLDILPSYYLDDLSQVIDSLQHQACGKALKEYLSDQPLRERKDVYRDRQAAKALLEPNKLSEASWPSPNGNALSYAQQLAVNVAVGDTEGLFSVNGPPGTGKTTLLRDVVSDVVVQRAKVLVGFEKPLDAFGDHIASNVNFKLKTTKLAEELLGHELVVAASNNNAAENISKELPKLKDINADALNQFDENWYFPEVANYYFGNGEENKSDQYWGMISAALGKKGNIRHFFNRFWGKNKRNSMRYLLERWTFHDEEFEFLVNEGVYEKNEKYYWISDSYRDLERKIFGKWKKERKKFKNLLEEFEYIQKEYTKLDKLFEEMKAIEIQSEKLGESIELSEANKLKYNTKKLECNERLQKCEAEAKELEKELKKNKKLLSLYRSYHKKEADFVDARQKNQAISEQLDLTKKSIAMSESEQKLLLQEIKDIEKDKQDYLKFRPNAIIQLLFCKSKMVKDWNTNFQKLVERGVEKKGELRKLSRALLELSEQVQAEKYEYKKQNEVFTESEKAYQEVIKLLPSLDEQIDLDKIKETVDGLKNNLSEKYVQRDQILNELNEIKFICDEADKHREILFHELSSVHEKGHDISTEITRIQDKYFHEGDENFPNSKYWMSNEAELQKTSPWMTKNLQAVRDKLFWSAMRLHKYFIILARRPLSSNITALKRLLVDNDLPLTHQDNIRSLWASLFLMVPVISSTFASVCRLFKHLKQEEIGWLMIDEAGQASPHYAVGAIWRSKRVIVVGDPLQVEPIVTLPKVLSCKLYEYYQVDPIYDVVLQSAQTLSDISNPIGTFIGEDDDEIWVGAPLIVHRRCIDPMFSVANQIAYNGLMIQATAPHTSMIEQYFNRSLWISPKNAVAKDPESHWIEAEGRIACYILNLLIKQLNTLPSIYIITPFKSVKSDFINYIKKYHLYSWKQLLSEDEAKSLDEKLYEIIDTIHTFQGKQADAVILLLGGNIRRRGAISWASEKPNMLNVAITRAKKLLYVIGNINVWGEQPYFSELAESMQVVSDGKSFQEKSLVVPKSDELSIKALEEES